MVSKIPVTIYRRINVPLLKNYFDVFGDLAVKRPFVVPNDESLWPTVFHGNKLGDYVHRIRINIKKGDVYLEEDLREIEKLGFIKNTLDAKSLLHILINNKSKKNEIFFCTF